MSETVESKSFFDRSGVEMDQIHVGAGIPIGIEKIVNPQVGIAGVYGAWGQSFDNAALQERIAEHLGEGIPASEQMNLPELGFTHRHHVPTLTHDQYAEMEIEAGARFLREAAAINHWKPEDIDGVLIGSSSPIVPNFIDRIAERAGIRSGAIKVDVHKACDGSVGSLNLALNPNIDLNVNMIPNLARELIGKKVLIGGIEGLSRFLKTTRDKNALQLFGNAAGVFGMIPGQAMKFIAGKTHEAFDGEGVLQVRMDYAHSDRSKLLDVIQSSGSTIQISGLQHEPADGSSVVMAGPMGMVKLFVRTGVEVIQDLYRMYQERLIDLGASHKAISVAIAHHANYKINKLLEKNLAKEGITFPMPWLLSEFGNVSAASNMIAFLRQLPQIKPGDHVLFDGFGAGTYYDALVVEMGG